MTLCSYSLPDPEALSHRLHRTFYPGLEHRLHRKKVLSAINKLKFAESEKERQYMLKNISRDQLMSPVSSMGSVPPIHMAGLAAAFGQPLNLAPAALAAPASAAAAGLGDVPGGAISFAAVGSGDVPSAPDPATLRLNIKDLMSWVRHGKNGKLKVRGGGRGDVWGQTEV